MKELLALMVIGLCYLAYSQHGLYRQAQDDFKALKIKYDSKSKMESLEAQEKCAFQARSIFDHGNYAKHTVTSDFSNHYSEKFGKCFVDIITISESKTDLTTSRYVFDAFEQREYGSVISMANYKDRRDKVLYCELKMPDSSRNACNSVESFEKLAMVYMADSPASK